MSISQILYILWKRIFVFILAFGSVMAGALGVMWLVPPRYDALATASIDAGQIDPVSGQVSGGPSIGLLQGNLVALAKSNQVATNVVKRLGLANTPRAAAEYRASNSAGVADINQWMAAQIVANLDAKFTPGSNVVNITYKSPSAQQSAQLANAFLAAFIDAAIDNKGQAAQQTAQWFDPQIEKLRVELEKARENLATYQREANLLGPTASDSENEQMMSVTTELSRAKVELLSIQVALDSNQIEAFDTPALTAIKSNLTAINTEISRLQTSVGSNNPKIVERMDVKKSLESQVTKEVAENKKKLIERIAVQKSKIEVLEKAHDTQLQTMITLQRKRDQLITLARQVSIRQDEVDRATKVTAQARLQSQLSFSNISVIDKAPVPTAPAFPKPLIVTIAGLGVGLCLGLILALLVEALDRRIRAVSDLEFVASVPVLGTMASSKSVKRWFRREPKRPLTPQLAG